jgi:hypothetical protein
MRQRRAAGGDGDHPSIEFGVLSVPGGVPLAPLQTHVDGDPGETLTQRRAHCAEVHLAYAAPIGLGGAHAAGFEVKAAGTIFAKLSARRPDQVHRWEIGSTSSKNCQHESAASLDGDSRSEHTQVLPRAAVKHAQVRLSARRNDSHTYRRPQNG